MNESQQKAVAAHADSMVRREYAYQQKQRPERFAAATPEQKADYEARTLADSRQLAESILAADETWIARVWSGALHPENKATRQLFAALTGHLLPPQVAATRAVVDQLYGPAIAAISAARKAEREARDAEKQAQWDAWQAKQTAGIADKVKAGDEVSGECLYTLAKSLSIEVHPRTVGTLRNRVRAVSENTGRYVGNGRLPMSVFRLYRECRQQLGE